MSKLFFAKANMTKTRLHRELSNRTEYAERVLSSLSYPEQLAKIATEIRRQRQIIEHNRWMNRLYPASVSCPDQA